MSVVRPARVDDAAGIAAANVASWREAYADLMSPAVLDGLDVQQKARFWREILAAGMAEVCVAEDQGQVVGFAAVRRAVEGPRPVELPSLYLLAGWHGQGLGQRLLDAVLGEQPAFLWVARDNSRAIDFYARNGFREDGEHREVPELSMLEVIRMVR